jgi:uncharacterized protein (DUF58 family)
MRLTLRGWTALSLVLVAVVLSWAFGQRSLNAVAAPVLAALVAAVGLVWRADAPTASYDAPRPGFPGQERTLTLAVEGTGMATLSGSAPPGLSGDGLDVTVSLPHSIDRTLALEGRGVYGLEPPEIRQRDPLGLVEQSTSPDAACELVVYPAVHPLADATLGGLLADPMTAERQEFDRLREYVPGDPLKNVHWKSSAKRDEFLVMEFAPNERTETVTIAADAVDGPSRADRTASAAATLALAALEAGLSVELVLPDTHLPAGQGDTQREYVLTTLARVGNGTLEETVHAGADVSVRAREGSTEITLPDGQHSFESLVTGLAGSAGTEVPA